MKRTFFVFAIVLGLAATAAAREPKHYQTGTLARMVAVTCGTTSKGGKSITGELLGTDSGSMKSQDLMCQEYVLQTDKLTYRIRPRDEKHPVILPIGEHAQFRLDKDKLMLMVEGFEDKERAYSVVAIEPRHDASADTIAARPAAQ